MSTNRTLAELERTRANLIQIGTVAEADYAQARVRVLMGGLTSAWLPWTSARAGGDRIWSAPEVGEQVLIACPDGDPASGVVLGSIFQAAHGAPADSADVHRTVYSDGAVIEYDRASHTLTATLPEGGIANLTAPGGVHITGNTTITGTLSVSALTACQGGLTVGGGAGATAVFTGDIQINGSVASTGDQVAGAISQTGHVHGGVAVGSSTTAVPQ